MIISGRTKLAGVMGWPVGHSRSPRLHGYWLDQYGIDGAYLPLAVSPDRFEQALRALPALGIRGVNLTVPHKEAALGIVDKIDPVARRIGAINTIFSAIVRFIFRASAESARANVMRWRAPRF